MRSPPSTRRLLLMWSLSNTWLGSAPRFAFNFGSSRCRALMNQFVNWFIFRPVWWHSCCFSSSLGYGLSRWCSNQLPSSYLEHRYHDTFTYPMSIFFWESLIFCVTFGTASTGMILLNSATVLRHSAWNSLTTDSTNLIALGSMIAILLQQWVSMA